MSTTVLLVEDEADLRMMTKIMLESRPGYRVLEAETGAQTLAVIDSEPVDVMLLDIRLPDMEGWDVLDHLAKQGKFPDLPVVMVSAHSTPSTAERALTSGVRAYVTKPFTSDEPFVAVAKAPQAADAYQRR